MDVSLVLFPSRFRLSPGEDALADKQRSGVSLPQEWKTETSRAIGTVMGGFTSSWERSTMRRAILIAFERVRDD